MMTFADYVFEAGYQAGRFLGVGFFILWMTLPVIAAIKILFYM
jgi:hypothetical protein